MYTPRVVHSWMVIWVEYPEGYSSLGFQEPVHSNNKIKLIQWSRVLARPLSVVHNETCVLCWRLRHSWLFCWVIWNVVPSFLHVEVTSFRTLQTPTEWYRNLHCTQVNHEFENGQAYFNKIAIYNHFLALFALRRWVFFGETASMSAGSLK